MTNTNRNQWMDVAKGSTIILMILGHASIPDVLSRFIYSFHMPLFFIASGWLTNWGKNTVREFFIKKVKSLVIPFITYSIIVLIIISLQSGGAKFFIQWLTKGWEGYALWFIPVLFISLLLVKGIKSISKSWFQVAICICLLITGMLLKCFKITLPWSMSVVPYASVMIIIGSYLKNFHSYIDSPKWYLLISGFAIALTISCFWKLDMAWNNIIPVIPLSIGALAGSIMMFTLASYIVIKLPKVSAVLQYIGRETFVIVSFSQIIIILCNTWLSCNPIIKYIILMICLLLIINIKNGVKFCIHKYGNIIHI